MKKALITGITGQDGYFLSQLLLEKGYEVHGLVRRNSQMSLGNLASLPAPVLGKIRIHWGDLTDQSVINSIIRQELFDEIYHLGAQSFVGLSFTNPQSTYDINIGGTLNIVNAVREYSQRTKLYFAATSELYGKVQSSPQNEETPFYPRSPYGVSKLAGFWTVKNYREAYNLFLSNGILFNHESEMRGEEFVTRKIAIAVARIVKEQATGAVQPLMIGNLESRRDWGYAGDFVEGMWRMLQHPTPDDFVLATGENHSIREFIELAFRVAGIEVAWDGQGVNEIGVDKKTGTVIVKIDTGFYRPSEVDTLIGDASKAKKELGWEPRVRFPELVKLMVEHELARK